MATDSQSDGEWEEESTVLVELAGVIDCDFLNTVETKHFTKALGLGTANPVVQIGSHIFSGKYETNVGTSLLFDDVNKDGTSKLEYLCHTDKKLLLKRVFLQKKSDSPRIDIDDLDDCNMLASGGNPLKSCNMSM
ncbi:general transcription factor 3C polypeptide 6-like [Argonauta hians]